MGISDRHVVVLDFPGIKRYVFGTDRLVEIRGASALLDQLNRKNIPEWIEQQFGSAHSRCVFVGGGAGQFIIEGTADNIRKELADIQGKILQQSGGALRMVIGLALLTEEYHTTLQRAFFDLEKNKRQNPFDPSSSIHSGFIRECESCSGMAAEPKEYADETRLLCPVCARKEEAGRERGLWDDFVGYLEHQGIDTDQARRPEDFEKIGERCLARPGYTALVYGDGNAMGRLVKKIDTEDRFRRFSQAVDEAVREACHEALWEHCRPVNGKIPADILLLGGDDLMVYLAADAAMPFAVDMARLFEDKVREKLIDGEPDAFFGNILGQKGLTLSIGIAYGRSHTPISIMEDQAEELLKSAKQKGACLAEEQNAYVPSCIDFHPTNRFNQINVADSRKQHLVLQTGREEMISLYGGPYTLEDAEALIDHANHLKESRIPGTRLHRLGEAPFLGKVNGTIETLTIYGRSRSSEQKEAIRNALSRFGCLSVMPWKETDKKTSTILVDLVLLAELTRD